VPLAYRNTPKENKNVTSVRPTEERGEEERVVNGKVEGLLAGGFSSERRKDDASVKKRARGGRVGWMMNNGCNTIPCKNWIGSRGEKPRQTRR